MARTEAKLMNFGLTQELALEYWNWTDDELKSISARDIQAIADIIKTRLTSSGHPLVELYIGLHDKDVREVWSEADMKMVIEQKPIHVHVVGKFEKGKGATIAQIAMAIGVEPQYVEKAKAGKYGYDNMVAYLIHIKYPNKYQYKPDEIVTAIGRPYQSVYKERKDDWLKGRAKIQADKAKADIDWLEDMILTGQVTKNQVILTDEYYNIYARNKRRIDDAFDTWAQRKIYKTMQRMEDGEFKVSVLYVTGEAGAGKSHFTDELVASIQKRAKAEFNENWTVCSVAGNNPFDEYMGDEILVMDDLRGCALTASDWLKLLDPDRINMGSARYRNKRIACRTIIINSERDVVEFFYYLKGGVDGRSEAMDQFIRRLLAKVVVLKSPFSDKRQVLIAPREEVPEYQQLAPDSCSRLTLHHGFPQDVAMSLDDSIAYATDIIMRQNGCEDASVATDIAETMMSENKRIEVEKDASEEAAIAQAESEIAEQLELEDCIKDIESAYARSSIDEKIYAAEDRQYH